MNKQVTYVPTRWWVLGPVNIAADRFLNRSTQSWTSWPVLEPVNPAWPVLELVDPAWLSVSAQYVLHNITAFRVWLCKTYTLTGSRTVNCLFEGKLSRTHSGDSCYEYAMQATTRFLSVAKTVKPHGVHEYISPHGRAGKLMPSMWLQTFQRPQGYH